MMGSTTKRFWEANEALAAGEMSPVRRMAVVAIMWALCFFAMTLLWVCSR